LGVTSVVVIFSRKCNGTVAEVQKIVGIFNNCGPLPISNEVVIAVPSIHLQGCRDNFRKEIAVASENVAAHNGYGAYTGEISGAMLKDFGVQWTLTGHSERRVGFEMPGESSELVGRKTAVALRAGLKVIACIGEHLHERESGNTMAVCAEQLAAIAAQVSEADWKNMVIAYEPVWAIGTGKVATPEQAEETHMHIRSWIADNVSPKVARDVRIIYGGSVKASNAKSLISCPNIDGFLVGGASLLPEFTDIMKVTK
jgi:triosephosphate isomerase